MSNIKTTFIGGVILGAIALYVYFLDTTVRQTTVQVQQLSVQVAQQGNALQQIVDFINKAQKTK